MKITEEQAEKDFREWLGWEGPRPTKDHPDYYTYSWELTVWINALRRYKLLETKDYEKNKRKTSIS